ncbi:MAG: hypothetical protein ACD_79C00567G0001 [uncultured bacterium]|nr:MAG: hypothetical protein ACD_79C00567G0001 [uncultured bacterium]
MTDKINIVFMGTPEFAAKHLEEILKFPDSYNIIAVLTQPDKPQGRSKKLMPSPVKKVALDNKIEVLQPITFKTPEIIKTLKSLKADVFITVAYGFILPNSVLEIPAYGSINIHASLLPKYRGAAPIQYTLLNGDDMSGVTCFLLDSGIDTGPILLQKECKVSISDDFFSLSDKLCTLGCECLIEALCRIKGTDFQFKGFPQQPSSEEPTKKITKDFGFVDFHNQTKYLHNKIRAFCNWPVCHIDIPLNNTKLAVKLLKSEPIEPCNLCKNKSPGEISIFGNRKMHIRTLNGCISILELQLEGKKQMKVDSFLNGHSIPSGICI